MIVLYFFFTEDSAATSKSEHKGQRKRKIEKVCVEKINNEKLLMIKTVAD